MAGELKKLFANDARAWDDFVRRHGELLFRTVAATVNRYAVREPGGERDELIRDICQDVFVKLLKDDYRLLKTYDPARAPLEAWLVVVSRSSALDALRRRKPEDALPGSMMVRDDFEERVDNRLLLGSVPPDLLSPREELIMTMLFERDLDNKRVAELLKIEVQTVRAMKHKALEKLRGFFDSPRGE